MKSEYYVYVYLDPRKPGKFTYEGLDMSFLYEPFYVGKGKGNRIIAHLTPSSLKPNTYKNNKIRKIIQSDIKPIYIKYKDCLSSVDSYDLEYKLIKSIGRNDTNRGALTNLTDGGGLESNQKRFSKAVRQSIDNNWIYFNSIKECGLYNNISPIRITEYCRGLRGKNSNILVEYVNDRSYIDKQISLKNSLDSRKRLVYQFDLDGNLINKWNSISEVSDIHNYNASTISGCLNNKRNTAYNYMWSVDINIESKIKILQFDLSGNLINKWFDIKHLLKETKIPYNSIIACLSNRNKSAHGFIWKYKNNTEICTQ